MLPRVRMPSFAHDILIELFRNRPVLAGELLHECAGIEIAGSTAELGSPDLSQVVPTEFRADAAIIFRDDRGGPTHAVVVEVQRQIDPDKCRTWPVYLAVLRARHRCSVTLLVIAPDPAVAAWARKPIPLGHPGLVLAPIVVSFDVIPHITSPVDAQRAPELAVLSSLAYNDLASTLAAFATLKQLPRESAKLYYEALILNLPTTDRQQLEATMEGRYYQLEYGQQQYDRGLADARERTLTGLLKLLHDKFAIVDSGFEARLRAASDDLTSLIVALGIAADESAAHDELERWAARHAVAGAPE